jgi:hypothetical protein
MSLEAVAAALRADLRPVAAVVLIHLADNANEHHVVVPYLPDLAKVAHLEVDELRGILDELVADGILSPSADHPHDFVARTEGFLIHLDAIERVDVLESTWSRELRAVS